MTQTKARAAHYLSLHQRQRARHVAGKARAHTPPSLLLKSNMLCSHAFHIPFSTCFLLTLLYMDRTPWPGWCSQETSAPRLMGSCRFRRILFPRQCACAKNHAAFCCCCTELLVYAHSARAYSYYFLNNVHLLCLLKYILAKSHG